MTSDYAKLETNQSFPRLPLQGSIDLTYRCNNSCRHCWLRISPDSRERRKELSLEEIKVLVDEARGMGCRRWSISGGEPMLRPDFAEIFDYITSRSASYSLNTNGTMITPEIADLMKQKGNKMVALYGATAEVHDHITRNPGSFLATMRGFDLLREAGVGFTVQLIPMRDNYHQFPEMVRLAKSLSPHWRVGAAWLYLSSDGDHVKNAEIARQRLSPKDVIELDKPDFFGEELEAEETHAFCHTGDDGLFAKCIKGRRDFHVDPYGQMTFCSFIKDPQMRYDLRKGSFRGAWEEFIPSLSNKIKGGGEYLENCGSCERRSDCRWCPVYGYLECGRYSAPVKYLCAVAEQSRKFKEDWEKNHRRYFDCAGITIRFESDLPFEEESLHPTFQLFQVQRPQGPREEMIAMRKHSELPNLADQDLGKIFFRKGQWAVRRKGNSWIYLNYTKEEMGGDKRTEKGRARNETLQKVAVFSADHTRVKVYGRSPTEEQDNDSEQAYNDWIFLTQTALSQVLANRQGCFLHSSGVALGEKGILFLGHSGAGKSTMRKMILSYGKATTLCDDRNVVRRWPEGYRVHGVWANKDLSNVSVASPPLFAIMFVEQAKENRIIPLPDRMEVMKRLLPCVIRPVENAEWWEKSLSLVGKMAAEIPCFRVRFDLSGEIVVQLEDFCLGNGTGAEKRWAAT